MSKLLVNISLRVWHPIARADLIAVKLGLTPRFAHNIGEFRESPAGGLLGRRYDKSYVSMPLVRKVEVELGEELMRWCAVFESYAGFLHELKQTGGKLEFYVSIFLVGLGGFELDNYSLQRIKDLGLGVAIELYPEDGSGNSN